MRVDFYGSWTSVSEKEVRLDAFSKAKIDVVAGSLVGMAKQIIANP